MAESSRRRTRTAGVLGSVEKRATGYRARYWGPDGKRHQSPAMFRTKGEARAWLAMQQADITRRAWKAPLGDEGPTLATYAGQWVEARLVAGRPLKQRTKDHYRRLLDDHILPTLGSRPVGAITATEVRTWHAATLVDKSTMRAHAYSLLRTILASAVDEGLASVNVCSIRGAGSTTRAHEVTVVTMDELGTIVENMPSRYRLMVLLATWCAFRYGELTELRRGDVDLGQEVIRVRRAVVRTKNGFEVGSPKSIAGSRDVSIPPHLLDVLEHHLSQHVGSGSAALLFPSEGDANRHLQPSTFNRHWYKARGAAGRDELRFHDLRHSGAVMGAVVGATLAELMQRLGHSTPAAALRYQHVAAGRDKEIAALLSKLANGA